MNTRHNKQTGTTFFKQDIDTMKTLGYNYSRLLVIIIRAAVSG